VRFPGEVAYRAERAAFAATVEALDPDVFESGPTLCAAWAPRDVLAHLLGLDDGLGSYLHPDLLAQGIRPGNDRQVASYRSLDRDELLARARHWAEAPAAHVRAAALFLIGDVAVHHQDVLRPNGLTYQVPRASALAIYREGAVLSGTRLLHYRPTPTDGIGAPVGFGRPVRGPALELGLWLSGRQGLDVALEIG
jgi:uncharacterized protein (TIGR03083 family)